MRMSGFRPERAARIALAMMIGAGLGSTASPVATAADMESLVNAVTRDREAGRTREAVAAAREAWTELDEQDRSPDDPSRVAIRRELQAMLPELEDRVAREATTMRGLADRADALVRESPAPEIVRRFAAEPDRELLFVSPIEREEVAELVAQARSLRKRLEAEPIAAYRNPEQRSKLAAATERSRSAAEAACSSQATSDVVATAITTARQAEGELEVCAEAGRVSSAERDRNLQPSSGSDQDCRGGSAVWRIECRIARADRRRSAASRVGAVASADACEVVSRTLEQVSELQAEAERSEDILRGGLAADLDFARRANGLAGLGGTPLEDAAADAEGLRRSIGKLERALEDRDTIAEAQAYADEVITTLRPEREAIDDLLADADALAAVCLHEWITARENSDRAQRCLLQARRDASSDRGGGPLGEPGGDAPPTDPQAGGGGGSDEALVRATAEPASSADPTDATGGLQIVGLAPPARIRVGDSVMLRGVDMGGRAYGAVTWVSTDTGVLRVSPAGTATGLAPGSVTILARAGGSAAYLDLEVIEDGDLVAGGSPDLPEGGAAEHVAAEDSAGLELVAGEAPDPDAPEWGLDEGEVVFRSAPVPSGEAEGQRSDDAADSDGWGLEQGGVRQVPAGPAEVRGGDRETAGEGGWGLDEGNGWSEEGPGTAPIGVELTDETFSPGLGDQGGMIDSSVAAADAALHGRWRLGNGREISFDCSGGVCVFGGWAPGDPASELQRIGEGRWTGTAKVIGRSGSTGGPMQVTSVDDVALEVSVRGDEGTVRMTTRRLNHGQPVDIAMVRVGGRTEGGGQLPAANSTPFDSRGEAPYHEFAAVCRIGWAAALSRYSTGPADSTIAEHLRAAGRHIGAANQTSFWPLKAWPDWRGLQGRFDQLADRLAESPDGRFRESLAFDLDLGWSALAGALAVQGAGEVQHRENCDSHYARLGYQLCFGQQAMQIAGVAEREGKRELVQRAREDARDRLQGAQRELVALPSVRLASGRCVDLSDVEWRLDDAAVAADLTAQVEAANRAFEAAVAQLSGAAAAGVRDEMLGPWCYSMFLDQKDLDHPETLCRIDFSMEGDWYVGRLVPGSCGEDKVGQLLIDRPPAGGDVIVRLRRSGPGRYEGDGLYGAGWDVATVEIEGDRARFVRREGSITSHRHLFRCR